MTNSTRVQKPVADIESAFVDLHTANYPVAGSYPAARPQDSYDRSGIVTMGIVAGFGATAAFVGLAATPHSWPTAAAAFGAAFGPLLGVSAWGLREFIALHRRRWIADLAMASNVLAGALLTTMAMVQAAVRAKNDDPADDLRAVWYGLDVAWDVYLGLGTILFALCAFSHRRLGRVLGVTGLLTAGVFLVFNLVTFPTPPDSAGLVDLGPVLGLWYTVVTITMLRSLNWARDRSRELQAEWVGYAPSV